MAKIDTNKIVRLMLRSYKRYQAGEIDSTQAYRENTMLSNILKAADTMEQEERLRAIEETLKLAR